MTLRPDVSQIPFLANVLAAMPDRVGQRLQTITSSPNSHALRNRSGPISPCSNGTTKCHPAIVRAAYLETPFSGHRARHEALDYFAGYAAVTGPLTIAAE